ncbi:helix-turn-helix domain-containing protein [Muriicola soli]|uniref:Helix-turn-helix domain-containing protein n=1 Tax=Muriicola soli TaxID=2507538 RepID=A0A411E852_9FLAO|nr:helix-turn-helix domain-containing protein [Muriicola soli]QBA63828.1 helix-turn-helix domain-containing protein [Muriicola soli]
MNAADFISRARNLVFDNLLNPQFGVEMLAAELGISRSELYKRIKKFENKSASQFIREIRLEKALELLRTDSYSIGEIAYMVGFHSPTYFSTAFKEKYGYPPSISKQNSRILHRPKALGSKRKLVPFVVGSVAILVLAISAFAALGGTMSKSVSLSVDRSTTLKAYGLYTEARELVEQRKDSAFPIAVELLEKAIELDPSFAEAYAEMSFLYGQWHYYGSLKKAERDKMMRKYLDLAISLDSASPEVLLARADYQWKHRNFPEDSTEILYGFQSVLEMDPEHDRAHYRLYQARRAMGQYKISHSHLEKASELEPKNYFYKTILARDLFWKKNERDRAMNVIEEVIKKSDRPGGVYFKSMFLTESSKDGHVQAFKNFHKALKDFPFLYGYMYWNTYITLDLDLLPLAERYSRLIQIKYPENTFYTYGNAYNILIAEQRYDEAMDFTIIWNSNKGLDDDTAVANIAKAHYLKGNLEITKEILLKHFGQVFESMADGTHPKVSITSSKIRAAKTYIDILRELGENDMAQPLVDFICSYYSDFNLRGFFATKLDHLDCAYLQNDLEGFLLALRNGFFREGNRLGVYMVLKLSNYPAFENEPAYQELFREIEQETHRMRAQVIEYLKAEGNWDPVWDSSLELYNRDVVMKNSDLPRFN